MALSEKSVLRIKNVQDKSFWIDSQPVILDDKSVMDSLRIVEESDLSVSLFVRVDRCLVAVVVESVDQRVTVINLRELRRFLRRKGHPAEKFFDVPFWN